MFGWVDLKIEEGVDTLNQIDSNMARVNGQTLVDNPVKRNMFQEDI